MNRWEEVFIIRRSLHFANYKRHVFYQIFFITTGERASNHQYSNESNAKRAAKNIFKQFNDSIERSLLG